MALSADTLLERLRLKEQLNKWRVLAVVCAVAAVVLLLESLGGGRIGISEIARVTIDGVIVDDVERDEMFKEIRRNPRIKAVIVRINSPGGEATGGKQLYDDLRATARIKPVIVVMRTLATSAAYMTALGADHIIAGDGTITGSIGVIMEMAEFTRLADKLGVTPIIIKSSPLKATPSPAEKLTPEAREAAQAVIDDFYGFFVDMVAERRKLPRPAVLKLADGRIYTGRQALANKLIDELGGEPEAIRWLAKNRKIPASLPVVDVKPDKKTGSFLEELTEMAGKNSLPPLFGTLDGLLLLWHPKTL